MPGMGPTKIALSRPQPGEYASYYEKYIGMITGTDIVSILEAQRLLFDDAESLRRIAGSNARQDHAAARYRTAV